jgi:LPS export ABC transporter protein LptC
VKNLYYSFAVIIVLSLVFWLSPFEKAKDLSFHIASQPEEYMSEVLVWTFTEAGDLKHKLSAVYWAYRPETSSSTLTTPYLTVYRPDNTIWNINAKRGKVNQPNIGRVEQVELLENVVLERPETKTDMPIKIETEVIRYQPKQQYAETDQFLTLSKPDLKITGTGMRAFLDRSFVELLQNVKTYYVPSPKKT